MSAGTTTSTRRRLRLPLPLPLLLLLLSMTMALLLLLCTGVDAVAPVGNVPVGCILPLTGARSSDGLRAQAALTLLVADVNAGVAVGGYAANFMGLAPGQTLVLDCRDSQGEIVPALAAMHQLKATWGSSLLAVVGELSDRVTVPLDMLAQSLGIMLVSPAATAPSLGQTIEHPFFMRTISGAESMTKYWKMINDAGGWRRLALISTDDDASRGFADVWLREIATMRELQLAGNYTGNASPFPYDVTSIMIPAETSSLTVSAIGQALDQLMASDVHIIQMQAGLQSEIVLRMAHARGMVGEGPDGVVRQWIGDFCHEETATAMQDTPGALFGTFCNMPPLPRTRADFPPTSAAAVAFEQRLQTAYPALYPNGRHIEHLENAAGSAIIALVGVMGKTFADPLLANTAANFFSWLSPAGLTFTQPDGTSMTIMPTGSADEGTVDFMGWNMDDRSFKVTGSYTPLAAQKYVPSTNVLQKASGSTAYPKDRPRIYITSDQLPVTFDGKMVVLAFVVVVLGAWTALILMEQALSFWSRAIWKQALGWVLLASVAFGACSVWPNTLMVYSSLTLDVDAKIYLEMWSIVVSAIYPMLMTILAFFICMHSVDGGFKPAANVNVNEVSDISGNSSTLSASGSGTSASHSGSSSVKSNMRQLKAGITRRINKLREFLADVTKRAGLQLVVASAVLAVLFVTQLMIVNAGMYVKAETAVQAGPIVGAAFFSWIVNVPALAMYFHVNRSGLRYLSPFLLSISLLGSFFIVAKSSVWTYVKERDVSPDALAGKVVADSTLAAIVAVVCAAVCIALMAFNVNRLRMSRNVLDKVLTQVAGQVRGLESEIEYEGEVRTALKEQGEFLRRSLEVISLCRPIWRPYAIALALADPEDDGKMVAASAASVAAALGPLEKARQLAPAGTNKHKKATGATAAAASAVVSGGSGAGGDEEKESVKADPVSAKAGGSKSKKDKVAGAAPEESAHSASGATAPASVPGQVLTPENKVRTVAASSASGSGSAASKAVTIAAPAAGSTAASHGPSDFVRIHAPKQEKQLVQLLKEVSDLNLSNAAPGRALADIRLPQLLSNPVTLELMKDVLAKNLSPENIACWIDIQRYRSLEQTAVRKAVADEIFSTFIVSGAKYEVNLSSFMRDYIQTQVYKGSSALDLFDEVEREIYRLMVTNNTEPFAQSTMFKLAAIVLQHPSYKLKSLSLANNTRGEIGGNVASTLGQVVQATSGSGGLAPVGGSYGAPSVPVARTIGGGVGGGVGGGNNSNGIPRPSMFVAAAPAPAGSGSNGGTPRSPVGTPSGSPRPAAGWGANSHGRGRSASGAQLIQQPQNSQDE